MATSERRRIPDALREQVLERHDHACWYCGSRRGTLHIDHVIPVCRGGDNDPINLVAACAPCNLSKGGKLLPWAIPRQNRIEREWSDRQAAREAARYLDQEIASEDWELLNL